MAQLEQAAKILPFLTVLTVLLYWTGKWYTEWYFNQFAINYNMLNLDRTYYLFASWNTVLTALALVFILASVTLTILVRPAWPYGLLAIVIAAISLLILFRWPFEFDPRLSFARKLLAAREFSLQVLGWVAMGSTFAMLFQNWSSIAPVWSVISAYVSSHLVAVLSVTCLLSWVYLGLVGYFLAKYHAQSAISSGRMGVKMTEVDGAWWLHVLRTSDGRNLVYDRKQRVSKLIGDDKISVSKDFVR